MDLKVDKSSSSSPSSHLKSCSLCHTTRTPLWRGGPAGPKSLCNACGIKYNKKRREMLGLDNRSKNEKSKKKRKSKKSCDQQQQQLSQAMKMRLMALGHDMLLLHRSDKLMNKLREEERAAILLMALSCGGSAVYA